MPNIAIWGEGGCEKRRARTLDLFSKVWCGNNIAVNSRVFCCHKGFQQEGGPLQVTYWMFVFLLYILRRLPMFAYFPVRLTTSYGPFKEKETLSFSFKRTVRHRKMYREISKNRQTSQDVQENKHRLNTHIMWFRICFVVFLWGYRKENQNGYAMISGTRHALHKFEMLGLQRRFPFGSVQLSRSRQFSDQKFIETGSA